MNNIDKYELIDKFLSNQLSQSEKVIFDDLVINDSDFSNEVEKNRNANKVIHQLGLFETSNKLNLLHKQQTRAKTNKRYWSLGAAAILLGGYGLYSIVTVETKSNSVTPKSIEITVEKERINDDKVISKPIVSTATIENIQEEKSTVISKDLEKIGVVESPEIKKVVDLSGTNEVTLNIIEDTSDVIYTAVLANTEIETISEEPTKKEIICGDIVLTTFNTEPSCIGEQNGKLIFSQDSLVGGALPYKTFIYRLGDQSNYLDKNQLASGDYAIKVVDANGCKDVITDIIIKEERCLQRIDDSFSPRYGEKWQYPKIAGVSEYSFVIKNMANVTILEKEVSLDQETDWNGVLENGSILEKGIYYVEIKSDQETYAMGTITIVE